MHTQNRALSEKYFVLHYIGTEVSSFSGCFEKIPFTCLNWEKQNGGCFLKNIYPFTNFHWEKASGHLETKNIYPFTYSEFGVPFWGVF